MVRPMLTAEERARGQRLGAVLRQARGDRSMVEVAALAGVPVETLRKIETGRIPTPAFFTVVALADAAGVSLGALAATVDEFGQVPTLRERSAAKKGVERPLMMPLPSPARDHS